MILYEAMVGDVLFRNVDDESYDAVHTNTLHDYMVKQKLLRFFDRKSFSLLLGLLDIDPESRINASNAKEHIWFNPPKSRSSKKSRSSSKKRRKTQNRNTSSKKSKRKNRTDRTKSHSKRTKRSKK